MNHEAFKPSKGRPWMIRFTAEATFVLSLLPLNE
jgi:hypothetical protein